MRWDIVIRGGTVVEPSGPRRADVAIADGWIAEVAPEIAGDSTELVDATGCHILPGVVDAHVHFNDPGRSEWEGFATGSAAFAAGGGTLVVDMPLNASPPTLDAASFDAKVAAARGAARTDFGLWGGLVPGNIARLSELAARGVVGFKAFMSGSGIDDSTAATSAAAPAAASALSAKVGGPEPTGLRTEGNGPLAFRSAPLVPHAVFPGA